VAEGAGQMPQCSPLIAVLDDEPEMCKALRRLLRTCGYRVEVYGRGADLLASLTAGLPACVVLDLHLPEMNGFEVLAAFTAQQPAIPIVVITGHEEPGIEEQVLAQGAAAYLKKPVDEAGLISAIEDALSRPWPGGRRPPENRGDKQPPQTLDL